MIAYIYCCKIIASSSFGNKNITRCKGLMLANLSGFGMVLAPIVPIAIQHFCNNIVGIIVPLQQDASKTVWTSSWLQKLWGMQMLL